ncbi:MAG: hypothetical protein ACE5J3_07265 [Methanosarcinales archaeon]
MKLKEPKEEAFPVLSQDMLFGFKLLSGLKHSKSLLDAPMLKEIYEEAMQEGMIKGQLEAIRNNLIEFLLARFEVPYKTGKQIEGIIKSIDSISVLQKLIGDLARSGTLEDFVKVLDKLEVEALKM